MVQTSPLHPPSDFHSPPGLGEPLKRRLTERSCPSSEDAGGGAGAGGGGDDSTGSSSSQQRPGTPPPGLATPARFGASAEVKSGQAGSVSSTSAASQSLPDIDFSGWGVWDFLIQQQTRDNNAAAAAATIGDREPPIAYGNSNAAAAALFSHRPPSDSTLLQQHRESQELTSAKRRIDFLSRENEELKSQLQQHKALVKECFSLLIAACESLHQHRQVSIGGELPLAPTQRLSAPGIAAGGRSSPVAGTPQDSQGGPSKQADLSSPVLAANGGALASSHGPSQQRVFQQPQPQPQQQQPGQLLDLVRELQLRLLSNGASAAGAAAGAAQGVSGNAAQGVSAPNAASYFGGTVRPVAVDSGFTAYHSLQPRQRSPSPRRTPPPPGPPPPVAAAPAAPASKVQLQAFLDLVAAAAANAAAQAKAAAQANGKAGGVRQSGEVSAARPEEQQRFPGSSGGGLPSVVGRGSSPTAEALATQGWPEAKALPAALQPPRSSLEENWRLAAGCEGEDEGGSSSEQEEGPGTGGRRRTRRRGRRGGRKHGRRRALGATTELGEQVDGAADGTSLAGGLAAPTFWQTRPYSDNFYRPQHQQPRHRQSLLNSPWIHDTGAGADWPSAAKPTLTSWAARGGAPGAPPPSQLPMEYVWQPTANQP